MITKVKKTIVQYGLFKPGETVVVGFSGGIDSVCLLHVLQSLAEYRLQLVVLYVNHSLRPEENRAEVELLEQYGRQYGLLTKQVIIDIPGRLRSKPQSLQLLARNERYRIFEEVRREFSASKIALAHHRDDQAETILYRLIRGTGLDGLAGIPVERDGVYVRPLLGVTRAEIRDYVTAHNLKWVEDSSNHKLLYQRNRLRHQLIPQIEQDYNPRFKEALNRLGELAREHNRFIQALLRQSFSEVRIGESDRVGLRLDLFLTLDPYLQYHVLRDTLAELGVEYRMELQALQKLRSKITAENYQFKKTHICHKTLVYLEGGVLYFQRPDWDEKSCLELVAVNAPGITRLGAVPMELVIEEASIPGDWSKVAPNEIYVDREKLNLPLKVRYWQPGDVFRPFGMTGSQKLHDFFINQKISRRLRGKIPLLLTSDDRIIWVVGYRMADDVKVTQKTQNIWRISAVSTGISEGD
ncbi:MAG TPA: tRNA lysidine(34) synthetase TilS [Bacillota bacterium]|nr:tRNA lysidine(34) synthetase TilS [Bacillota bacterium]HPT86709.1 tRNA lysidine(34) synthetase TilS [Bacillota bacterium]